MKYDFLADPYDTECLKVVSVWSELNDEDLAVRPREGDPRGRGRTIVPRGLTKAKLHLDDWLKEVGPSTELRKWFGHDPETWDTFRARYARELGSRPETWQPIVSAARRGTVTLVYRSHDAAHNNAVALQQYLRSKVRKRATSARTVARLRRSRR